MPTNYTNILNFEKCKNSIFILLGILIFFCSYNNGMFWDNVLFASKMGNHLYDNSIFNWTIPDSFDPGHPPFLGFLLAVFWKVLGHKLWVSHLLMLPFVIGCFYQLYHFISYFVSDRKNQISAFLLVVVDPTLSAQFVLVNPEIIIIFFFFVALNGLLFKKNILKFIGLFFLSIITFRSMMVFAGIFLFEVLSKIFIDKQKLKTVLNLKFMVFYFMSSLPGIIFVAWRLLTKGWLQTHPNSPWASLWQLATPKIFVKNVITLFHRYLDFGRIFLLFFLVFSLFLFGKKILASTKNKQLILLSITSIVFIIIAVLVATNAFGHRYFIVSFSCLNILVFCVITNFFTNKKLLYIVFFIGLITGNLWIYPKKISQGWDATLAHIPYHSLRIKTINYLDDNHINIEDVASFFPNYTTIDNIDFSGDKRAFVKFDGKNKYVFYSTVYNLSDEHYEMLNKNYTILKEFNKFSITNTIYILNNDIIRR